MRIPSPLPLNEARIIIADTQDAAAMRKLLVSSCVVDAHGNVIAMERMDGASWVTSRVALAKAFTAAAFGDFVGETASIIGDPAESPFWATATTLFPGGMVYGGGGVSLRIGDMTVGAIAVSGGTGQEDHDCAETARAQWMRRNSKKGQG